MGIGFVFYIETGMGFVSHVAKSGGLQRAVGWEEAREGLGKMRIEVNDGVERVL